MPEIYLYDSPILPVGFKFPKKYILLATQNSIINIEPWTFLYGDMATSLSYYGAMLNKYKDKTLIPFAIASDPSGLYNDGYVVLACFDGDDISGDPKVYFHDYGCRSQDINWDQRYNLENFSAWFNLAEEESARYKAEQADE
ncbi:hypothetical protein BB987_10835 [Photorhabdus temperata]|uniref:SMI1/KNR4 family protein n=2 Tax=Photorhabdus khanii TaxID=1004150 RepID=W3V9K1_9GAMM|nr:hypothetical protein [Photorhabdus khanii]ETS32502.1 hypothetical protein PTE_01133 [Photorhabdus khanii NC19]MQL49572.1 hypothetical protein [Photorhabdus khanii]OHV54174.1 hypothetical protein BB987_10835 [Photorhabdus temperata]